MLIEKYKLFTTILLMAFWAQTCCGFISETFLGGNGTFISLCYLFCDAVFLVGGLCTLRSRRDVWCFGSFLFIAVVSMFVNGQGFVDLLNGSREFFGLLFAIPIIRYFLKGKNGARFAALMDRQLFIFLILQAVTITYQFIIFGANDHGGGTYGFGGSGMASSLIYTVSYYLVLKNWDTEESYWANIKANKWAVILLYPTFLNETKVSFIFLLVYFLTLAEINRRFILRTIKLIPVMTILTIGAGWAYFNATELDSDQLLTVDFFNEYLVGEDIAEITEKAIMVQDEGLVGQRDFLVDVPRFAKLILVPEALSHTSGDMALGAGLGQFKGGTMVKKSEFATRYAWLLLGSVPFIFFVIVQLGIVGMIWFFIDMVSGFFIRNDNSVFGINVSLYVLMVALITMVYNDQLRFSTVCFVMFYVALWGLQPGKKEDKEPKNSLRASEWHG